MDMETELELQRAMGRLEAKVDQLISELHSANARADKEIGELTVRIASLEKWKSGIVAVGVFVSGVLSLAIAALR